MADVLSLTIEAKENLQALDKSIEKLNKLDELIKQVGSDTDKAFAKMEKDIAKSIANTNKDIARLEKAMKIMTENSAKDVKKVEDALDVYKRQS